MLLIIPSWVAFGAIGLFFISASFLSLFKKQGAPAFITTTFSVRVIEKIASHEKMLSLISDICFFLCTWFFAASFFSTTS